jgi:Ca2+/H+ antiporter, TMEM165/GDT1 family
MKRFWIRKVIGIVCMAIIGVMVFSGIVMLLWNALLPELFHFPVISFWQALGLLILTKLLFGGFRGGGPGRGRLKDKLKDKMNQRWMNMTPEEKEKFKQDWGRRCRTPFGQQGPYSNEKTPSPENPL